MIWLLRLKQKRTDTVARYLQRNKSRSSKRYTWAPREEVIKTTGVVLTTIILFTLILWLYDSVFGVAFRRII